MATTDPYKEGPFGGLTQSEVCRAILDAFTGAFGTGSSTSGSVTPSPLQASAMEFGGSSNVFLTDAGTSNTGTVFAIEVLTDTVIGTLTAATGYTTSGIPTKTLPAGTVLYGRYSVVTITTGNVIAYKA